MRAYHGKTSERTPRANSTFQTTETRETYRMAEELRSLLNERAGIWQTVEVLISKGHKRGWCRPFTDYDRISHTHPYGRILTNMLDPKSPLYTPNLEVATWMPGAHRFRAKPTNQ